jgi:hypothetical protein
VHACARADVVPRLAFVLCGSCHCLLRRACAPVTLIALPLSRCSFAPPLHPPGWASPLPLPLSLSLPSPARALSAGPEYAGTRFDAYSRTLWSGSNAAGGIDLCLVTPESGGTAGTGAWVPEEHGTSFIMAATAVVDGPGQWHFITASFDGAPLKMHAVDISNKNITMDRIQYSYALPTNFLSISNLHTWVSDPIV